MQFASTRIITDDVEGLTAFYERLTGELAIRRGAVFSQFTWPGRELAIGDVSTVAIVGPGIAEPRSNRSLLVEFLVDDVDAEWERLSEWVTDFVNAPTTMPWGNRSLLLRDPDGNLINLFARPGA